MGGEYRSAPYDIGRWDSQMMIQMTPSCPQANLGPCPLSRPQQHRKRPSRAYRPLKRHSYPRTGATIARIRRRQSSEAFLVASPSLSCPLPSCSGASASNAARRRARLLLLYLPIVLCRCRRRDRRGTEMSHRRTLFRMPFELVYDVGPGCWAV